MFDPDSLRYCIYHLTDLSLLFFPSGFIQLGRQATILGLRLMTLMMFSSSAVEVFFYVSITTAYLSKPRNSYFGLPFDGISVRPVFSLSTVEIT